MLFEVHALPKADYEAWLAGAIAKANATPAPLPSGEAAGAGGRGSPPRTSSSSSKDLTAAADTPFTIHFKNEDAPGVPHNIEIKDASGAVVFKGDIIDGGKEINYAVPALAAGTYPFICTVHPNMTGTLTVQ